MRFLLIVFVFFFARLAFSYQSSVVGSARSYPSSGSLEAQIKEDWLLWGQADPSNPMGYGFASARFNVATQGMLEAAVSINPVSFVELGYAQNTTYRFIKRKMKFDCDVIECMGELGRQKTFLKIGLAYQEFVFMPSYQLVQTKNKASAIAFYDEIENFVLLPDSDEISITSVVLGYKKDKDLYGVVYRGAKAKDNEVKNQAVYAIYKSQTENFGYTVGAGSYQSDFYDAEFSAIAQINWVIGDSLSLF